MTHSYHTCFLKKIHFFTLVIFPRLFLLSKKAKMVDIISPLFKIKQILSGFDVRQL